MDSSFVVYNKKAPCRQGPTRCRRIYGYTTGKPILPLQKGGKKGMLVLQCGSDSLCGWRVTYIGVEGLPPLHTVAFFCDNITEQIFAEAKRDLCYQIKDQNGYFNATSQISPPERFFGSQNCRSLQSQ